MREEWPLDCYDCLLPSPLSAPPHLITSSSTHLQPQHAPRSLAHSAVMLLPLPPISPLSLKIYLHDDALTTLSSLNLVVLSAPRERLQQASCSVFSRPPYDSRALPLAVALYKILRAGGAVRLPKRLKPDPITQREIYAAAVAPPERRRSRPMVALTGPAVDPAMDPAAASPSAAEGSSSSVPKPRATRPAAPELEHDSTGERAPQEQEEQHQGAPAPAYKEQQPQPVAWLGGATAASMADAGSTLLRAARAEAAGSSSSSNVGGVEASATSLLRRLFQTSVSERLRAQLRAQMTTQLRPPSAACSLVSTASMMLAGQRTSANTISATAAGSAEQGDAAEGNATEGAAAKGATSKSRDNGSGISSFKNAKGAASEAATRQAAPQVPEAGCVADEGSMDHAGMASQLQQLLTDCDADADGQLSRKEFFRVLADIGLDLDSNSKEAGQLFLSLDRNAAGVVALDDLRAALTFIMDPAASRESAAAMPSSLVSMLADDHKQKGNPILRLRESLASQGSRVIDMFNKWDTSGDGKIQKSVSRGYAPAETPPTPACAPRIPHPTSSPATPT